jgi:ribose transport system substrate-binding protein
MEIELRSNPSDALMAGGFSVECKKLGYTCEVVGALNTLDVPSSNALATAALSAGGVVAFGDYGFEPEAYPFMKQVSSQYHLPIVSWHIPIKKGAAPGLTATTLGNPAVGASLAAKAMGKKLGGKGTVAVTQASFNTIEDAVAKSFTSTMHKDYPKVTVLAPQVEGTDPASAVSKATSILSGNSQITGAFSTTGGGATTWSSAAAATNRKITIIGTDYVPQNLALLKAGKVFALMAQPLFQEGEKTAELLAQAAQHKKISYYNPLPEGLVTSANIGQYEGYISAAIKAGVPGLS